ncbi:2154_t:CDS:1, partial [Racocetra fulgida]
ETSREEEYKSLFDYAVSAYNKKEFKTSYCSFHSVAYGYKIENTELAYNAKYFLAIHLLNGLGISKNSKEALNLFEE